MCHRHGLRRLRLTLQVPAVSTTAVPATLPATLTATLAAAPTALAHTTTLTAALAAASTTTLAQFHHLFNHTFHLHRTFGHTCWFN